MNPVIRFVWYGFSTWTPAAGRSQSTETTSRARRHAASSAMCSQRVPATKSTASRAAPYTIAVPRSGWMKTSAIGTAPRPTAVSTVRIEPIRRDRSARNPAIASTNSVLPNSDGWNWNGPITSQRFEPRTARRTAKTKTIIPIVPR